MDDEGFHQLSTAPI